MEGSAAHRERAYAGFRRRGDPDRAAECALALCVHYRANLGNSAASAGWLARATRLVDEFELDEMRGWLQLMHAGGAADPADGERLAREARALAREGNDLDLELCALAEIGAALVRQGNVADGLAALDEAMAGSLGGEGGRLDTVVYTSCNMISSCVGCAEFERAVQWLRAADGFTERYGCPFLYAYCRTLPGYRKAGSRRLACSQTSPRRGSSALLSAGDAVRGSPCTPADLRVGERTRARRRRRPGSAGDVRGARRRTAWLPR